MPEWFALGILCAWFLIIIILIDNNNTPAF